MRAHLIAASTPLMWRLALGCNDPELKSVENPPMPQSCLSWQADGPAVDEGFLSWGFRCSPPVIVQQNKVDVLFVVDRSAQGYAWQLELADTLPRFVEALAEASPAPDLQIGIVGAQQWGERCLAGPSLGGSGGAFSSTSCLERAHQFSSPEVFENDCVSRCASNETSDTPWFTFAPREGPVDAAALAEQLRCAAVLGDRGCPTAQPFGSAYAVLKRQREAGLFFRDASAPIIVILSATDDCTPQDDTVFGNESVPADCWDAGTDCVEDEADVWSCEPRSDVAEGEVAGLVPVEDLNGWIEAQSAWAWQLATGPGHLALWMGWEAGTVAPGSVRAAAPATAEDEAFLGVAPSCTREGSVAAPPVRAAAVWGDVERRGGRLFDIAGVSLCEGDLASAMDALTERVLDAVAPGCVPYCVADQDEDLPGLQPDCEFLADLYDDEAEVRLELPIPVCERDRHEGFVVPDDAPGCVELRMDSRLDARCEDRYSNLAAVLHWQGPPPSRLSLIPSCSISHRKATDCAGWPGG